MSRCFPFPPPGYEKKASNDHHLEIAKKENRHKKDKEKEEQEKHKENRHKKDKEKEEQEKHKENRHKKDKEKGEHKRRKDEYGSTEKHKKKKDWKERQKEKYRKTSRDHNNREVVDGNKEREVSDEKIIKNYKGLKEQKSGESTMLVDAIKTSTFAESFDRNVQENGTKRMLFQNLVPDVRNGIISREFDSVDRSFNLGKETRNEESDIRKPSSQRMAGDMVEKTTSFKSSCTAGGSLEKDGQKSKEENNSNKRTASQMCDVQIQKKVKDRSREKSKKRKDRIKDKEKKKEKHKMRREKFDHKNKEHKYIKDFRKEQDDISHSKSLISLTNPKNGAESDGSLKRKEPENLLSLDYDIQPNKLSRAATPLLDERNRSRSNFSSAVPPQSPNLNGTTSPIEKILLKDSHTNGTRESIVSSVTYAHPSADESDACEVSTIPAHTDSQYLMQIYSVPEMEELSDTDDQEWLFRNDMLGLKPDSKFKFEETTDVIALPYVIPY